MPKGAPTLTAIGHDPCTTDRYIHRHILLNYPDDSTYSGQCIVGYGSNHRLY